MPPPLFRSALGAAALLGSCLMPLAAHSQSQPAAASKVLYTLATRCSLAGGPPQPCTVEAIDGGTTTLYRHHHGPRPALDVVLDNRAPESPSIQVLRYAFQSSF